MGFHPDFTGRQNVHMAGQLLGLTSEDINQLMPQIVEFSEIGEYIDKPVRIYSSGMQVRLAFSVATVKRPDILIVDEALAVGDVRFQQKCFERIERYKEAGTSLIFVSHDLNIVYRLCHKALLINEGALAAYGDVRYVASEYEAILKGKGGTAEPIVESKNNSINATVTPLKSCFFTYLVISGEESGISNVLREGEMAEIRIGLKNLQNYDDPHLGLQIRDRMGVIVFETNTYCMDYLIADYLDKDGFAELSFLFKVNLARGVYTISFDLANKGYGSGLFSEIISLKEYMQEIVITRETGIQWDGICNLYPSIINKVRA